MGCVLPTNSLSPKRGFVIVVQSPFRIIPTLEKALEIGCGSGIVTMVLATLGWEVSACDLNPFAVSATRGNMENNGIPGSHRISESGVGENLVLPERTRLVIWNLPYLGREDEDNEFEKIEEMAWSDIPSKGWGGELLNFLESQDNVNELLALMVLRRSPREKVRSLTGRKRVDLTYPWFGETRGRKDRGCGLLEDRSGRTPNIIDACSSTMEEVLKMPDGDWVRVMSRTQKMGEEEKFRVDLGAGGFSQRGK